MGLLFLGMTAKHRFENFQLTVILNNPSEPNEVTQEQIATEIGDFAEEFVYTTVKENKHTENKKSYVFLTTYLDSPPRYSSLDELTTGLQEHLQSAPYSPISVEVKHSPGKV